MANKKTQHDSLNAEQASSTSEAFIDKYKKTIAYTLVAAVVLVAGIILYHNFVAVPKEARANELIFKGQDYFAENNYEKALNGDGQGYPGFIQIADEYGSTKAGNLCGGRAAARHGRGRLYARQACDQGTGHPRMEPAEKAGSGEITIAISRSILSNKCSKAVRRMPDGLAVLCRRGFPAAPPLPQEAGAANAVFLHDPSCENGFQKSPQTFLKPEI